MQIQSVEIIYVFINLFYRTPNKKSRKCIGVSVILLGHAGVDVTLRRVTLNSGRLKKICYKIMLLLLSVFPEGRVVWLSG